MIPEGGHSESDERDADRFRDTPTRSISRCLRSGRPAWLTMPSVTSFTSPRPATTRSSRSRTQAPDARRGDGARGVSRSHPPARPARLVLAPNGDLITINGDGVNPDPNQPSELVEFTPSGQFVGQFSIDSSPAAPFGLALATPAASCAWRPSTTIRTRSISGPCRRVKVPGIHPVVSGASGLRPWEQASRAGSPVRHPRRYRRARWEFWGLRPASRTGVGGNDR